jgi:hypothetical protein
VDIGIRVRAKAIKSTKFFFMTVLSGEDCKGPDET